MMATKNGIVKKTKLTAYDTSRRDGIIAISLDEDDELIGVRLTSGKDEIFMGTSRGKAIRFHEDDVRAMGRNARGVIGIKLDEDDTAVSVELAKSNAYVVAVTEKGFGKKTDLEEYKTQLRGGKGLITFRYTPRIGNLVSIKIAYPEDELLLISSQGIIIRFKVKDISTQGRVTQGVTLMRIDEDDTVKAVATISHDEDD